MSDEITTGDNIQKSSEQVDDFVADKPNETEKNGGEYQEFPGGPFKEGNPGGGREKETEEEKEAKRIRKEIAEKIKEEYLIKLAENLPEISPALLTKAKEGDISAIKEVHDRVFGKALNNIDVTTKGESLNTALVKFLDGNKDDNYRNTKGV